MVHNELFGVGYGETFAAPEKIAAVSFSDVNRLAATVLNLDAYTLAVLRGK
jgi:predicted Zn-dependent peptidase